MSISAKCYLYLLNFCIISYSDILEYFVYLRKTFSQLYSTVVLFNGTISKSSFPPFICYFCGYLDKRSQAVTH